MVVKQFKLFSYEFRFEKTRRGTPWLYYPHSKDEDGYDYRVRASSYISLTKNYSRAVRFHFWMATFFSYQLKWWRDA